MHFFFSGDPWREMIDQACSNAMESVHVDVEVCVCVCIYVSVHASMNYFCSVTDLWKSFCWTCHSQGVSYTLCFWLCCHKVYFHEQPSSLADISSHVGEKTSVAWKSNALLPTCLNHLCSHFTFLKKKNLYFVMKYRFIYVVMHYFLLQTAVHAICTYYIEVLIVYVNLHYHDLMKNIWLQ